MNITESMINAGVDAAEKQFGLTYTHFGVEKILEAALSAAPTPPEIEPVAWVDVKDSRSGPYEFHGIKLLGTGKHHLYTSPPSPKPKWDADGNPLNLEAAAMDTVDYLSNMDNHPFSLEGLLHRRDNLRKFLPDEETRA